MTPSSSAPAAARGTLSRDDWNQRYAVADLVWTAQPNCFVQLECADLAPGRALDLAAGEGRNAVWLAEHGWTVHAVDFAGVALAKARQLAEHRQVAHRLSLETADLRDYTPAGGYDLVLLAYLQLPQAELAPILRRAAGALAKGGTLLVVAHDSANLAQGVGGPQDPALLYSSAEVLAALDGVLRIDKMGPAQRTVSTAEGPRQAIDCVVRASRARHVCTRCVPGAPA
jgi:SAM-dependent methyltransferase